MGKAIIIKGVLPDERISNGRVGVDQEVWMINCQTPPPKWDRWFQLHGLGHIWDKHGVGNLRDLAQMSLQKSVYLYPTQIERWEYFFKQELHYRGDIPHHNFKEFPIEQMCDYWGIRYFTGSFALLVAFATWQHINTAMSIESIEFAGVDLWPTPRKPQYPDEQWAISCTEFWLSKAHSEGIKIYPDSQITGIMHDVWGGLYGLEAGGNE